MGLRSKVKSLAGKIKQAFTGKTTAPPQPAPSRVKPEAQSLTTLPKARTGYLGERLTVRPEEKLAAGYHEATKRGQAYTIGGGGGSTRPQFSPPPVGDLRQQQTISGRIPSAERQSRSEAEASYNQKFLAAQQAGEVLDVNTLTPEERDISGAVAPITAEDLANVNPLGFVGREAATTGATIAGRELTQTGAGTAIREGAETIASKGRAEAQKILNDFKTKGQSIISGELQEAGSATSLGRTTVNVGRRGTPQDTNYGRGAPKSLNLPWGKQYNVPIKGTPSGIPNSATEKLGNVYLAGLMKNKGFVALGALGALSTAIGSYPWAGHNQAEAIEQLAYAEKTARAAGDEALANEIEEVQLAVSDRDIIDNIPIANVVKASLEKARAGVYQARAQRELDAAKALGTTPEQIKKDKEAADKQAQWEENRQTRLADEAAQNQTIQDNHDRWRQEDLEDAELNRSLWEEAREEDRDRYEAQQERIEARQEEQQEEERAYYDALYQRKLADREEERAYWASVMKQRRKEAEDRAPSNLKFGLL